MGRQKRRRAGGQKCRRAEVQEGGSVRGQMCRRAEAAERQYPLKGKIHRRAEGQNSYECRRHRRRVKGPKPQEGRIHEGRVHEGRIH
jgi:hypothetical protein